MTPALEFVHVTHIYDNQPALQHVSFAVSQGQILCLLGPSGCGKTTALRIAAGLEQPQSGQVLLNGQVVSGEDCFVPPECRGVGLLFQDYALFPHLSVADNIAFGLRHLNTEQRYIEVAKWLERVDLKDRLNAYPHMLSGGEQQRIALARALAPQPAILLLDEPFSNLDSHLRQQVRSQVLHVLKDIGATALLVTHEPEEALFMGDRIALMTQGNIIQQGASLELYFAPRNPQVASFFGHVNRLSGHVKDTKLLTSFGELPAPDLADDRPVEVVIRAEGLHLKPLSHNDYAPLCAMVTKVHLLGGTSLIELRPQADNKSIDTLVARKVGASRLVPGTRVSINLDPDMVFMFPEGPCGVATDAVSKSAAKPQRI
jgi:iron(III) transport system ATP-binding protein